MTAPTTASPTGPAALEPAPPVGPVEPRPRRRRARWLHWPRWDAPVWRRVGASVASGLVLAAAYPPFDLGPLALVALVPLLWAWRDATPRRAALYGFWFGVAFFGPLLSWIWYFGAVAFVPLVVAGGWYVAAPGALVAVFARHGFRSPWLTAALWVLFEQLRARFPFGGLPWGETGAALHDVPVARSLASWGGVAFVTFLVVAFNGFLVDAFSAARSRSVSRTTLAATGLAAVVALTAAGHAFRYQPTGGSDPLRIATIQGNDQNRDIDDPVEFERVVVENHFQLAEQELEGDYDLIVFPESSLNRNPTVDQQLRERILDIGAAHDSAMLVNALLPASDGRDFNTNLLYGRDGRLQGKYAKQHLVPFGEYVPYRDRLDFLGVLDQIPYDYAHGPGRHLFEVSGRRMATIICFESAFAPLVRDFVRDGAEFVVVSTNNRSYRRSGNAAQHLALSQMRAAETGRPVVHASISGISGVIDADGDVHDTTDLFVNEVVTAEITPTTGQTPYVRYGEWLLWSCGLALVGLALFVRLRRTPTPSRAR
ncbi:MAG: apolipoprotein N-acyltransferase [Acidimicrobiia bacterium]